MKRQFFLTLSLLLFVSCNVVVGDNNTINSNNSAIVGPGSNVGSDSSYNVDGVGIYFMESVLDGSSLQMTVRNVGSYGINSIDFTYRIDYTDGSSKLGEQSKYWGTFLPGEIKVFTIYDYSYNKYPSKLTILTGNIDPSGYDTDPIALTADPLITFYY